MRPDAPKAPFRQGERSRSEPRGPKTPRYQTP